MALPAACALRSRPANVSSQGNPTTAAALTRNLRRGTAPLRSRSLRCDARAFWSKVMSGA
jgi:hypothetical protein